MEMNVEHRIPATPQQVWKALNDTEVLRAAIPGCESLETRGENTFQAQVVTKVGPVKAKFSFNVILTDLDPPNSYTINAEGQGGAAGFANGSARVTLRPDGGETILAYHAQAHVGGKLAQLGARLIDGTARKLAGEFFTNFGNIVAGGAGREPEAAAVHERPGAPRGIPRWAWAILLAGAALVVISLAG